MREMKSYRKGNGLPVEKPLWKTEIRRYEAALEAHSIVEAISNVKSRQPSKLSDCQIFVSCFYTTMIFGVGQG
ncbi:hypothetical protein V6N13_069574 [Hibiscus sabdariffa]